MIVASTEPIVWHYDIQRSAVTRNTKVVRFSKKNGRFFHIARATQHVRIPLFCRAIPTVQAEQNYLIVVTHKAPNGKPTEYSAARIAQNIKRKELFYIIIANVTREKKTISKNRVIAIAEKPPKLMLATRQTTVEMLSVVGNRKSHIEAHSTIQGEI